MCLTLGASHPASSCSSRRATGSSVSYLETLVTGEFDRDFVESRRSTVSHGRGLLEVVKPVLADMHPRQHEPPTPERRRWPSGIFSSSSLDSEIDDQVYVRMAWRVLRRGVRLGST